MGMVSSCGRGAMRCTLSSGSRSNNERPHQIWAGRLMCVSEVSIDVQQAASCLARPRVCDRPMILQVLGFPWGSCCPGAFAFDAVLVASMQDLLYGARWSPAQLLRLAPGMAFLSVCFGLDLQYCPSSVFYFSARAIVLPCLWCVWLSGCRGCGVLLGKTFSVLRGHGRARSTRMTMSM